MTTAATSISTPGRLRTYASFVRFEAHVVLAAVDPGGHLQRARSRAVLVRWTLIALAAVGARTAAMALNRLIDRGSMR